MVFMHKDISNQNTRQSFPITEHMNMRSQAWPSQRVITFIHLRLAHAQHAVSTTKSAVSSPLAAISFINLA